MGSARPKTASEVQSELKLSLKAVINALKYTFSPEGT
jgi:hypothetical protein